MSARDLSALRARQAELVRALVADGPVPAGFAVPEVSAAAEALLRKRAREVADRYPELAYLAGPDFQRRYMAWARGRPKAGTRTDATRFARDESIRWLPPGSSRYARLVFRLRWRIT